VQRVQIRGNEYRGRNLLRLEPVFVQLPGNARIWRIEMYKTYTMYGTYKMIWRWLNFTHGIIAHRIYSLFAIDKFILYSIFYQTCRQIRGNARLMRFPSPAVMLRILPVEAVWQTGSLAGNRIRPLPGDPAVRGSPRLRQPPVIPVCAP
jgi:hypothetical protein